MRQLRKRQARWEVASRRAFIFASCPHGLLRPACSVCYAVPDMKFDRSQQAFIADKLMDSANYALAGLVFGQLITDKINPFLLILGVILYLWGWRVAVRLQKGVKRR